MKYLGYAFIVIFDLLLFAITQAVCFFSVGALEWFFTNLPSDQLPSDYMIMSALNSTAGRFFIQWLPVTCLAFSILFFMSQKILRAYLLIALPLIPAAISMMLFYNAAQMHVPPGESLFGSGVLIGKQQSPMLSKDISHAD